MNIAKFILPLETSALRPGLACEVTPRGVAAARRGGSNGEIFSAYCSLRPGSLLPGLKTPNVLDRAAIVSAIRQALDQVKERDSKISLVIPDAAVRVLLLDFDTLPAKAAEILPIVRFRLRKLVPFETEDASLSYQVMSSKDENVRVIVAASPGPVVAEYEAAAREAGYEPGVVLPSTLAALAAVESDEPSLVVNHNAGSVTTAITQHNDLLLHRTLELSGQDGDGGAGRPEDWRSGDPYALNELQQSVSVAVAYFEDTLSATPRQLLVCGMGGAEELSALLADSSIPLRDLVPAQSAANAAQMPRGALAGVRGALAS